MEALDTLKHQDLCERALRWLRGTRKCNPVFAGIASCSEIPDAIGWSSSYKQRGSTVVECKVSRSDFYRDKKKRIVWKHPTLGMYLGNRITQKEAAAGAYIAEDLPVMGDYRFFLSEPSIVTPELIAQHAPDHGLLCVEGSRIRVVVDAPRRKEPNYPAEIRYLRFAIINRKKEFNHGNRSN
jgi:hypothetical protein